MRQTKRYSPEIKEKAYMMSACGSSAYEISRKLNVPRQTVEGWIKARRAADPDKYEAIRENARKGFVEQATGIIDKGMELLDRRITTALDFEKELDKLLSDLEDGKVASVTELRNIAAKLEQLKIYNLKDITTAIGTLYDKRALAKGEATEHLEITPNDKALMEGIERIYNRVSGEGGDEG